jgi:hypothetical protein
MVENKLYFSIRGEFGVQMTFEAKEELPYELMARCINKDEVLRLLCLEKAGYTAEDIQVISQEEYEEKYGGSDDE